MTHPNLKSVLDCERYLRLLARDFPTISSVTTEIINLEAILHLPKPTEHFMADLHGENEAFQHVLRNASGNIKRKVQELFSNSLRDKDMTDLCTLIYYPEQKLELVKQTDKNIKDYYQTTLNQLIAVCRRDSSKYTRSKVRKSLPSEFTYIIEELLHESTEDHNKEAYVNVIIQTIIGTKRADQFIIALCYLIQRMAVDQLHLLGDIFDRGPGAHLILNTLETYHHWDIQWGNHDILWMGAAAGNPVCVASVLRLSLRYANMQTLEEGYAINLLPLSTFAMETYAEDPCEIFIPKLEDNLKLTEFQIKSENWNEARKLFSEFNKILYSHSGLEFTIKILKYYNFILEKLRYNSLESNTRIVEAYQEHLILLEYFKNNDIENAKIFNKEHLLRSKESIMTFFEKKYKKF